MNKSRYQRDQKCVFLAKCFEVGPTEKKLPLKVANGRDYTGLGLTLLQQKLFFFFFENEYSSGKLNLGTIPFQRSSQNKHVLPS